MRETVSSVTFYSCVFIAARDAAGQEWTGTGFLLSFNRDFAGPLPLLITNRHVLNGASEVTFSMIGADGDQPAAARVSVTTAGAEAQSWAGHRDPDIDIACMLFQPVIDRLIAAGTPPFYRSYYPGQMLTPKGAEKFDAIEEITFLGYPSGLYDTTNFLPIARRGHTATPLQVNYRGEPSFLIDAPVFGGSSGSPVLPLKSGAWEDREGTKYQGSQLTLAGVVAAVHLQEVVGNIVQVGSRSVAVFGSEIDLGIVYTAEAIHQCAIDLIEANGLSVRDEYGFFDRVE